MCVLQYNILLSESHTNISTIYSASRQSYTKFYFLFFNNILLDKIHTNFSTIFCLKNVIQIFLQYILLHDIHIQFFFYIQYSAEQKSYKVFYNILLNETHTNTSTIYSASRQSYTNVFFYYTIFCLTKIIQSFLQYSA